MYGRLDLADSSQRRKAADKRGEIRNGLDERLSEEASMPFFNDCGKGALKLFPLKLVPDVLIRDAGVLRNVDKGAGRQDHILNTSHGLSVSLGLDHRNLAFGSVLR